MKRILYANAWIATLFGSLLTLGYYVSFYDQVVNYTLGKQLLIGLLMIFQIWGSVALIWILSALAQRLRTKRIILAIKIIVYGILLFMIADAATLFILNMKFSLSEGLRLISGGIQQEALLSFDTLAWGVGGLVLFFVIIYMFFLPKQSKKIPLFLVWLLSGSLIAAIMTGSVLRTMSGPYLGSLLINPLLYNINILINTTFDKGGSLTGGMGYPEYFTSFPGLGQRPNIIVIFAESFEPKYSLANSGIYNYLPRFDTLQRDGVRYNNFLAPGCVSENAHAALLQGIFPFSYGDIFTKGYQQFTGYVDTLPYFLNKQGYDTTFLSTVSLKFLDQYDFLSTMGFKNIIGDEVFRGIKDYVFLAAPDKALYTKGLSVIDKKLSARQPFYLNMQTISSHKPRNTPYGKTEKLAWMYTDDQLGLFYERLRKTNFFDNGILIIFGDHRVPLPLSSSEKEKLGPLWPTRVLATVIGHTLVSGSVSDMIVQPIDIHFSLKHLIAPDKVLLWRDYNDIFDPQKSTRNRGLYSCKYSNDIVSLVNTGDMQLLDTFTHHPAYGFVDAFKNYQQYYILKK